MNRRNFLKSMLASSVGACTSSAMASQLSMVKTMAAQSRFDDYKALVCIYLYGGNDSYNMLLPVENQSYQTYAAVRQNLAVSQENIITLNTSSELPYALGVPDSLSSVADLFHQQDLAFVTNVGPLQEPTTKSDIQAGRASLPPQLFSHNDQQKLWQRGSNDLSGLTGWAGRAADLLQDANPNSAVAMNISLGENNVLQTGANTSQYAMTAEGVQEFGALNPEHDWNRGRISVLDKLIEMDTHKLGRAYSGVLNRARNNAAIVRQALAEGPELTASFADNPLAAQLNMAARMISVRQALNMQRQVFFIGFGGWDTHDRQNELHPGLLSTLAEAMVSFNSAMTELGVEQDVVTFTASEFGRTLTSNGDGTDHGWAGHQMVMGGGLNGGRLFGQMPSLELGSEDDVGEGRIIPTTSSEQYAATLAKWFGLSDAEVALVFPQLNRFDQQTLALFG